MLLVGSGSQTLANDWEIKAGCYAASYRTPLFIFLMGCSVYGEDAATATFGGDAALCCVRMSSVKSKFGRSVAVVRRFVCSFFLA